MCKSLADEIAKKDIYIWSGTELSGVLDDVETKSSTINAAKYELVVRLAVMSTGRRTTNHVMVQSLEAKLNARICFPLLFRKSNHTCLID